MKDRALADAPLATSHPAAGIPGVASLRCKWFLLVIIPLLWAAAYLPALGTRPLRLEEGRRATPAREMLQSGNYVVPTLYGEPYLNKPPLFFWLVASASSMTGGVNEWSDRLPSVIAVLLCAFIVARFAAREIPRETRLMGALFFLSSIAVLDKGALGEIESAVSLFVFAASAAWYAGYSRDTRQHLGSWAITGVLLGLAMLTKGPPAVLQFYLPLIVFLLWQRDIRRLFSLGHLLCIVLIATPIAGWVYAIYSSNPGAFHATIDNWLGQMGVKMVGQLSATKTITAATRQDLFDHYVYFPLQAFQMILPWGLVLLALLVPSWRRAVMTAAPDESGATQVDHSSPVVRYLLSSVIVSILFFWLWPTARPRHMMAVCQPAAMLSAIVFVALIRQRMSRVRWVLPAALGLAITILLGRGAFSTFFNPHKAPTDAPRLITAQIASVIPPDRPAYTTLTFASGKGESLYNVQFYFSPHLRALPRFADLPPNLPARVFMAPADWDAARTDSTLTVQLLADVPLTKAETPAIKRIIVADITRHAP